MERQVGLSLFLNKREKDMLLKDSKELGLTQTGFLRLLIITWHNNKVKETESAGKGVN
jgi:hypothetical protein